MTNINLLLFVYSLNRRLKRDPVVTKWKIPILEMLKMSLSWGVERQQMHFQKLRLYHYHGRWVSALNFRCWKHLHLRN